MGDQKITFGPGNILSPVMRSSRGKMFLYIALFVCMGFVAFLLSSAHSSIKQLEAANEKCQQQRDSLSAQLQVVYEHKNRLEKSLQQEKTEHKRSKEDSGKKLQEEESKIQQEKEREQGLENEISQLKAKYSELEEEKKRAETSINEQHQGAVAQKEETINQLQVQVAELKTDKEKLEHEKNALAWQIQQQSSVYESQNHLLSRKVEDLNKQLSGKPEPEPPSPANPDRYPIEAHSIPSSSPGPPENKVKALEKPVVQKDHKGPEPEASLVPEQPVGEKPKVSVDEAKREAPMEDDLKRQLPMPFSDAPKENNDKGNSEIQVDAKDQEQANIQPPVAAGVGEMGENALGQLEVPQDKNINNEVKNEHAVLPNINDINADRIRDTMNKSPDEGNEAVEPHRGPPFQGFRGPPKANLQPNLGKDRNELPDRHYGDEDDEDPEGDDQDDIMAGMQGAHKGFNGQDFDDQEPNENINNHREGIAVHPR